ncbi:MAG: Rpn family recombination-promoting nuclease/putative transposase [Treponema sp.]|nr:Rpn family recombination-promoting nuclease/putative transposase [Treponema sp.]
MAKENREIKSGVFADLFGDDEKVGKKNFLSLYNAIHDTNLTLEETQIEQKKIPQAIIKTFYNDVSMIINGKLIVLIEHQSTPNKNMPLRCLEYYVHLLYGIIPARARYKEEIYKIPTPEFYVFYNGTKKVEQECIMKLSDAFCEKQEDPLCEVKVKFTNIRGKEGENLPVVQKCDILKQYCEFMEIVSRHHAELSTLPTDEEMETCYEKAINEAISKNILADYLTRKGTEVRNMFFGEYDYDLDMQVKAEEAREAATQQKAIEDAQNLLREGDSPEKISRCIGLPLEQVLELQREGMERG